MALEHILGETQVSRRGFLAASLGTILASALPAFGQDQQVAKNNPPAAGNAAKNSVSFDDIRSEGDRYLQAREYRQAIDAYTRALAVEGHEHDPTVLNQRGLAKSNSADLRGAIEDYEHSLRYDSVNPITRKNLALNQYRLGRDQRDQALATSAVHNLWFARELAYAQGIALESYTADIEDVQRRARTDFAALDTTEATRGMTREERYHSAQALTNGNKPAALYFYRRVAAANATDEMGTNATRRIPTLERYIQRNGLAEIAMAR